MVDDEAPGWDAINAAVRSLYGDQQPRHVAYSPPAAFSANLQGCSAFATGDQWHYISYGLSELYHPGPEDDPAFSGWGFELTLRVPRHAEDQPPEWPFTMINEMAKHVNSQRVLLEDGHRIDLLAAVTGYPHTHGPDTALTVFAVTIDTPNGRVTFLQLVGVTAAEKDAMVGSTTAAVLADLASRARLLVTDPARAPADSR